jgi:hypothetical protein
MTNLSLFFIRHGKLLLPYRDHSEMPLKILADLAIEKLNPPIDKKSTKSLIIQISPVIPFKNLNKIYTSPSRRCQETTILIKNFMKQRFFKELTVIITPELKEIRFNLKKIYIPRNKECVDINTINEHVFKAMINGEHCESVCNAYKRIKALFTKINKNEKSLFVTHDFIMRVIEIYIKDQKRRCYSITFNDLKNTKRNLYLHGFATDSSLSTIFYF